MRTWLTHGAVVAALGIAICLPAAPVSAELEAQSLAPSGEAIADAPLPAEPDPLFDEDFDAELELSSDVDHADPFHLHRRLDPLCHPFDRPRNLGRMMESVQPKVCVGGVS